MMEKKHRFSARVAALTVLLGSAASVLAKDSAQLHDWGNPAVLGINKEKTPASFVMAGEKVSDPRVVSLNGQWRFKWSPDPESRPPTTRIKTFPLALPQFAFRELFRFAVSGGADGGRSG